MQRWKVWRSPSNGAAHAYRVDFHPALFLWAGLLSLLLAAAGCSLPAQIPWPSREHEIPFETLEQSDFPPERPGYRSPTLSALILTSPEDLEQARDWISGEAFAKVQALNFNDTMCFAVFQGLRPSLGYRVTIDQILQGEKETILRITTTEPTPSPNPMNLPVSPYQLVKIKKESSLLGLHDFRVVVNGSTVVVLEKVIP